MSSWRAVQTKPRYENYARLHLERLNVPTFLPLLHSRRRTEPLFPTYLFADLEEHPVRVARYAVGVIDVIGTIPIAPVVIEELMERHSDPVSPMLIPGAMYRLRRPG